jgi:peroxiredoxin
MRVETMGWTRFALLCRAAVRPLAIGALVLAMALAAGCGLFNKRPLAAFERSPGYGPAPLSVFFDATASTDPDGEIADYRWSFGDGSTGVGATLTHTYPLTGVYAVELRVLDDRGASGTVTRMVSVTDPEDPPPEGVNVGQTAVDFTLDDLSGEPVSLSDFRGHVVMLEFWATWCTPCTSSMPHLESLRATYASEGLVLIGVSQDETWAEVADYVEANGYTEMITLWGSLAEADAVRDLYEVIGIPRTFIIDRQGVIRHEDHPNRIRSHHIEPWL